MLKLMFNRSAISLFISPVATRLSTSISRCDSSADAVSSGRRCSTIFNMLSSCSISELSLPLMSRLSPMITVRARRGMKKSSDDAKTRGDTKYNDDAESPLSSTDADMAASMSKY